MVSSAKLYDEKTTLVYQVEAFKDQLEDSVQEVLEMRAEAGRLQSVSRDEKQCCTLGAFFQMPFLLSFSMPKMLVILPPPSLFLSLSLSPLSLLSFYS